MKALKKKGSGRVFGIMVGNSTVFIPENQDPEKKVIELTFNVTTGGVPLTTFSFSFSQCLGLIEQMQKKLIKAGWTEEKASQILPRGGCNGDF